MDFEFTEEQKMFREAIRDFGEKEIEPIVDEYEEKHHFPVELFPKMGKLGYLCVAFPAEYGAAGMGMMGECIEVEELARFSSGITSAIMVQGGIGTDIILEHGTEEQKQKYLVPAIKGEMIGAFGVTEPNAGSDASTVETTAVRDGDSWVINGSKIYITNGPICSFVLTAAYTDKSKGPGRGISTILMERDTPGFSVTSMEKLGHLSTETGELAFEDCRVPIGNLVGEEGRGLRQLLGSLNPARISHSARSVGVAQRCYEETLKYAQERVQYGQPIGKYQSISFKICDMAILIEAARWLVYHAAWVFDKGERARKEASMAKAFAAEAAVKVATDTMRIGGGVAYMTDSPIQRYFREAILFPTTEGTSEIQRIVIGREIGL